jgi:hypothetical protein
MISTYLNMEAERAKSQAKTQLSAKRYFEWLLWLVHFTEYVSHVFQH